MAIPWPPGGAWRRGALWPRMLLATTADESSARSEITRETAPSSASSQPAPDPFEAFVHTHERDIFTYLWRMLGDEQAAYDLSQETFLRAWRHFARVRGLERPGGWLFRVATHLALNARRQRATQQTSTHDPERFARSDPAARIVERETIAQVLHALPVRQRAALVLREVYGLPTEEVASSLGISPPAARMLLSRAREQFRAAYRQAEERP